ncbi:cytochrome C oxidase subunit IV family protein [Alicyclobacillus curvatus]|jgi:cytochrome o ubiquinol oxidase subunit IV|nr:cytochrome C oxidase subunit IV family protein [Alicyclobacillus curvatus]
MSEQAHSSHQDPGAHGAAHQELSFPWQYVIGFALSLVLTIVPLWLVVNHVIPLGPLTWAILAFAILQIFVQLFMFMHFTHTGGSGPAYQTVTLTVGFFFTFVFIGASIWIMSFHAQVS